MKEFETPAIKLAKGLRQFGSMLNSGQLEECFNLMPVESGLESHDPIINLNASGVTWGGLGKLTRPMESDTLVVNVKSLGFNGILSGVTVYLDGVSQGTTDTDGNISIAGVSVGIHDLKLTKTGYNSSDVDVIYNDYIIVAPKKEVVINVDDFYTSGNLSNVKVWVDGAYMGKTNTSGNLTCWLRPGTHRLELQRSGFTDEDRDVLINDYFTVS